MKKITLKYSVVILLKNSHKENIFEVAREEKDIMYKETKITADFHWESYKPEDSGTSLNA